MRSLIFYKDLNNQKKFDIIIKLNELKKIFKINIFHQVSILVKKLFEDNWYI